PDGGILNDPVLLHVGEDRWWMQLADSDAGLYALGAAARSSLDVEVSYPQAYPMQVQGAKAAKTLEKLVGPAVLDLKYYWCDWFDVRDIPVLISRTGWTAVQGFEINLLDPGRGDDLWDAVFAAGGGVGIGAGGGRRPMGRGRRGGGGVRDTAGRAGRGAADRGRDHELQLGYDPRGHAAPSDGSRASGRGAAAGLHRQGRARGTQGQGCGSQARGDRVVGRRAQGRALVVLAGGSGRRAGRPGHRCRLVTPPGTEHRVRVGPDRPGRPRDRPRRGVRAWADLGHDRRDPVHRRSQGGPGGLPARVGSAAGPTEGASPG